MEITGTPGEVYERQMVPAIFSRWAPLVADLAAVKAGERVLDLACGTGALTRVIADRVGPHGRVVGLDLSPGMLVRARAGDGRIECVQGDATALPLPDSSFDAVVCQQGFSFSRTSQRRCGKSAACWSRADVSHYQSGAGSIRRPDFASYKTRWRVT